MSEETPTYSALSPKQRAFVDAFIEEKFCATRAARKLGIKSPKQRGSELRANRDVARAIDERLSERRASANMIRDRLEEQAFATLEDCIRFERIQIDTGRKDEKGLSVFRTEVRGSLDLNKARRLRKLHLIGKITERSWFDKSRGETVREIQIEHYNSQAALIALGKGHGLFDKVDLTKGKDETPGVIRGPLRGQLSEEERTEAAKELEPSE